MITFNCLQKFTANFSYRVGDKRSQLISIDGVDGSGKSYLSKFLVNEKGYSYIDIDGRLFDYSCNIEDILNVKRKEAQEFESNAAFIEGREPEILNNSEENMQDEIIRYHFEYQLENNADIIFENIVKIG